MGRQMEKLRAERRIGRNTDPHAWAEQIERDRNWRTMAVAFLIAVTAFIGWQVFTVKQDIERIEQTLKPPCTPTAGPSGELPPPGFC